MKTERPPEEHFMYLQKTLASSPDPFGSLAMRSVSRKNLPISKGHIQYGSMMLSQIRQVHSNLEEEKGGFS